MAQQLYKSNAIDRAKLMVPDKSVNKELKKWNLNSSLEGDL